MECDVVATLGPSSEAEATWKSMTSAGVSAFRLNTSHLTLSQLHSWLERLNAYLPSIDPKYPLVLDLQGSKWRLGAFTPFELTQGQSVELLCMASADREHMLPVPHADFFEAARLSNGEIVLNDARIRLILESIGPDGLKARVIQGGAISPGKGITLASSEYRKESLSEKDRAILEGTQHLDFIRYAISYVKDAAEMSRYRALFGPSKYLIAKLERKPAMDQAARIAECSDEVWLCRGDLGAELGMKAMAEAVDQFSDLPGIFSIPVLMAGQVLEHMVEHPAPTRSEVCYLHDCLIKGYAGFVLSDETAIGHYPVESCKIAAMFRA